MLIGVAEKGLESGRQVELLEFVGRRVGLGVGDVGVFRRGRGREGEGQAGGGEQRHGGRGEDGGTHQSLGEGSRREYG